MPGGVRYGIYRSDRCVAHPTHPCPPQEQRSFYLGSMARPPRPQHAGLWYHVGTRGVRKMPIVHSDDDRRIFLDVLGDVVARFD